MCLLLSNVDIARSRLAALHARLEEAAIRCHDNEVDSRLDALGAIVERSAARLLGAQAAMRQAMIDVVRCK